MKVAAAMTFVRAIEPKAPAIGSSVRIFCGVTRTKGRPHHTTVRGPDDVPRRCKVLGYEIHLYPNMVDLIVRVRMNQRHPLISRAFDANVDCLECC